MGTTYTVKAVCRGTPAHTQESLQDRIDAELVRINKLMSTYDPESEISRFNGFSATSPFPVSEEMLLVVRSARGLYESSGGLFDPTVGPLVDLWGFGTKNRRREPPPQEEIDRCRAVVGMNHLKEGPENTLAKDVAGLHLDLSAIAKGYGVDMVAELLGKEGYSDLMVEIGGEIVVRGKNQERKPWRLGVDSPVQIPGKRNLVRTLSLTDTGLATSGNYRNYFMYKGVRYTHVLNPKNGYPVPESVVSATVVSPTCMRADGAATAMMVLGATEGLEWAENQGDIEALVYVRSATGAISELMTPGMEKSIQY